MHPSQPTSTAYSEASRRQVNKSGFSTCGLARAARLTALEQSLTSDNSYLSGMGNAINGTVNHQVGETIKGDAPSPIIKAIQAGQLSKRLLKALLAEGANVNYSSQIYGTPLMTACSHGPLSVVELLLRHG